MKFAELPRTNDSGRPHRLENAVIASVSLSIADHGLLSGLQKHWKHGVPKTKEKVGQRINLTFRFLSASRVTPK